MTWWYYILLIGFPLSGGLISLYSGIRNTRHLKLVLAFAGAYLLSIVLMHLIPHLYEEWHVLTGVFLLTGFFFQVVLERFSRGAEHGHMHVHEDHGSVRLIPYEILISLSLHSLMEGMPLGSNLFSGESARLSFLTGIVLHELPAAFAMVSILHTTVKRRSTLFVFIAIYSCMSSAGAFGSEILRNQIDPQVFEYLMAFVAGTFLHIATTILFENSDNHRFSWGKILSMLSGIALALAGSLLAGE